MARGKRKPSLSLLDQKIEEKKAVLESKEKNE